jgi:hypothetical protein
MKKKTKSSAVRVDAFISHASKDLKFAALVVQGLESDNLHPWIDHADVHFGALLRNELQDAIGKCRTLVLIWSRTAAASRWVISEILTAFHLNRFIIPCVIDGTPLPQFLQNAAYLERRRDKAQLAKKVSAAVRAAPNHANEIPALLAAESPELKDTIHTTARAQAQELQALGARDLKSASKIHGALDNVMKKFRRGFPLEPMILNLAGYHHKNAYMLKHWDAIQAGRAPKDPLLEKAERCFFESLCVNPLDPSALNGIGSILMFERELDAAEFFQRRAISSAKREGYDYPEAKSDLEIILSAKNVKDSEPLRA